MSQGTPKGSEVYRARKCIEWEWSTDMTQAEMGDELNVSRRTVQRYLSDPPDELKDAAKCFKSQVVAVSVDRLKDHLAEARSRAENAEQPSKVFAYDDDGDLVTEEIEFEGGGSKLVPKVEDMEMQPNQESRFYARKEEREIIEMLWRLTGAEEPDQHELDAGDSLATLLGE